jgi:tetratricopeptide (TPR) repeat protein
MNAGLAVRRGCFVPIAILLVAGLDTTPLAQTDELERGIRLQREGRIAEAKAVLEPIARRETKNARAAFHLGQVYLSTDDVDRGVEMLERAVRLEPGNAQYHLAVAAGYRTKVRQVSKLRQASMAGKIRTHLERAVEIDPNSVEGRMGLVQYYWMAPGIAGGSKDKARQQAAELKKRNPPQGAVAFGFLHEQDKDYAAAEREYTTAIREHPDSTDLRYALANLLARREKYAEAMDAYEEILRRKPDDTGALYQVGRVGAQAGLRLDRAEEALRAYLKQPVRTAQPSHAAANWRLGMVLEKKGQKAQAKAAYEEALRLEPGHKQAQAALKELAR